MSIAAVVTRGYGSFGTIADVVTAGYGIEAQAVIRVSCAMTLYGTQAAAMTLNGVEAASMELRGRQAVAITGVIKQ